MPNPFTLGIVRKEDFCNREKEIDDLLRHGRNGDHVVLFSPRRYGKSSLIAKVLERLEREGFLTVYVDLFPISSEHDFISRFSAAVFKGIGRAVAARRLGEKIRNIFSRLVPSFDVGPEGYSLSVKFDRTTETGLLLDDLMDGIYRHVKKEGRRACIALDEFQEITELSESKKIEGILRSHIQLHKEIAYFFIGSRRRILKDMFSNKNRPFYKSGFLYILKEIPKERFAPYIESKFKRTGKICPRDVGGKIYDSVRGYPYYVQKLASIVWEMTETKCAEETVKQAYQTLLDMERVDFEGIWSGLALIQKSLLKALAREPTPSPYAREFLEQHRLSVGGTQKAMQVLLARDLVEKDDRTFRLTDPVMADWLRK